MQITKINRKTQQKGIIAIATLAIVGFSAYYFLAVNPMTALKVFAAGPVNGCDIQLQSTVTSPDNKALTYDMTVTNKGLQTCNSASLTVYYSTGETAQSTTPKATSANYYWKLGNMTPDQSFKITAKTSYTGNDLHTEACATAYNGSDSCIASAQSDINATTPVVVPEEPEPTPPTNPPTTPPTTEAPFPSIFYPKGEYGMWVWTSPVQMTDSYRTQLINTAYSYNINTLYVTIDDYLDVYNLPAGTNRTNKLAAYNDAVAKLVDTAKLKNISIDAEAGWKDWSSPSLRANSYNIIDYVSNYNATHAVGFRKVQFDVEPYLLSTYENNKASVLTTYVNYLGDIMNRSIAMNVDMSLVIPHFYDSLQKWTPTVTYNGRTDYTFNHILRILDTRENSTVILMSYRNFATGKDSVVQISQQEIKDASTGVHPTKVIVGQETGDVDPSYVTYFGMTKKAMFDQFTKVNNQFKDQTGYNGIGIHYYEPFSKLRN